MHLAFDIFQGLGVAAAAGIRPFLPALITGALAAGDIQIDFRGTDYSFLQGRPFLFGLLGVTVILVLLERRWRASAEGLPGLLVMAVPSLGLGALLFAGAMAQDSRTTWPGLVGGVGCALIGLAATVPLLRRVRARLDAESAGTTFLFAEGAALALAAASVLAPPVGPLAVVALGWLAVSGLRRRPQKYAGLRILR